MEKVLQQILESLNQKRHEEIMEHLSYIEKDMDHTWEKTVRNERQIAVIKKLVEG